MTGKRDSERIIAAAIDALPGIVAALDPESQPAVGSWVAVTVRAPSHEAGAEAPVIQRSFYTWRHDAPLEPLEEAEYLELTRDPKSGRLKVPAWAFDLTPVAEGEWHLGYWFGAPLRMWLGERAGDRVMGHGLSFVARRADGGWSVEFEDILAS